MIFRFAKKTKKIEEKKRRERERSSTYHFRLRSNLVSLGLIENALMAPITQQASKSAEKGANSLSRWVEANKNLAIALGLGTIAVGGAGVYYYLNGSSVAKTSSRTQGLEGSSSPGEKTSGSSASSNKKKKSKKSKKNKEGSENVPRDGEGPLLDEASDHDLMALSEEEIARLPEAVRVLISSVV